MPIRNDPEFDTILRNDFKEIVDEVVDFLLTKMQESMDYWVYGAGTPAAYERQYDNQGFYDTYQKIDATVQPGLGGTLVSGEVDQDPMRMNHYPDIFIHGSKFSSKGDDIRSVLAEIIIEGTSGPLFGNGFWRQNRNYFKPVENLLNDGTIDRMVKSKMQARGMNVI